MALLDWSMLFFFIYTLIVPGLAVIAGLLAMSRRVVLAAVGFFLMAALGVSNSIFSRFVMPWLMDGGSVTDAQEAMQLYQAASGLGYVVAWILVVGGILKIRPAA
ncbi:MAG: hypothetical protein VX951_02435 [Planctomycetota bacterium]|nr:hypothetical protein [Planctomycetota bacterium]